MKDSLYPIVGQILQDIRKKHKVSQQELADMLDLSRTSISNMENGRHPIFLHHIYTIAEKFNIPLDKLLPSVFDIQNEKKAKEEDLKNSLLQKGITDERTINNVFSVINKSKL
ncbi:helix-turn-helix domain-containing protein [Chryseobacterium sp. MYb328]|uniref:helix-turn-helix domain-containing protein n=1 Tax=Chryseobacterium sp. MYb328 TaxID=2745231 RepID=UPI0030B2D7F7